VSNTQGPGGRPSLKTLVPTYNNGSTSNLGRKIRRCIHAGRGNGSTANVETRLFSSKLLGLRELSKSFGVVCSNFNELGADGA
jgi:hypothetical protein